MFYLKFGFTSASKTSHHAAFMKGLREFSIPPGKFFEAKKLYNN